MKIYQGRQSSEGVVVTADNQPLAINHKLNESQSIQFSWGDASVGSEQLALSLLADSVDETHALILGQEFMRDVVSKFDDTWEVTSTDIREWCEYKSELHGFVENSEWSPTLPPDTAPNPPRLPNLMSRNYKF